MEDKDTFSVDKEICMNYEEGREDFHGAVVPPVFGNTLFTFRKFENLAAADNDLAHHYVYRRGPNPTVEVAERKLAALERGEACRLFGSGMAAISAALLNSLKQGDHLLVIGHIYATTLQLIRYLQNFGISFSVVYNGEFEQAIRPNTRVIYMESPTNMVHRIIDLEEIANFARKKGIRTIIDNTWATPLFQKPLTLGIDMVIHSGSKYLGGHSDCMAGTGSDVDHGSNFSRANSPAKSITEAYRSLEGGLIQKAGVKSVQTVDGKNFEVTCPTSPIAIKTGFW